MQSKILGIFVIPFITISSVSFTQEPIDVTDQTIKIGGGKSEEIMLGFAAGDKILFNFSEINGKNLKEIEILEYPETSKFSDFKTAKVENKRLSVLKQSIYIFRFKNSALGGRICKITIQRIPASEETRNFNTAVSWVEKQDTTWNAFTKDVVIGYDTVYQQKPKKELISSEKKEVLILDKTQRVHSITNGNGNKTSIFFTLPPNVVTANKTSNVIAWAYWIGVGEEANKAWQTNANTIKSVVVKGASYFTTPLGALAIGAIAELITPKLGEDVIYSLVDQRNQTLFTAGQPYKGWDYGKGIAGYKMFSDPSLSQGTFFVCMENDNTIQGIDATVKVIAIIETNEYQDKVVTEMIVNPRYEKKIYKDPLIKKSKALVTNQ
jgi:hypothetical protein